MMELLYTVLSPTALVVLVTTLLVVYCMKSFWSHPSDLPPMPRTPVPILGHLPFIKPSFTEALKNWRRKAGDIFSIYIGSRLVIVVGSYESLNECLVKQGDKFSHRPPSLFHKMWKDYGYGVGNNSGASWKEQRTASMTILRNLGMGKNWLAEKISEEVEVYLRELDGMKGQSKNLQVLTNTAVSNIICAIMLGKRFEYNDPFLVRFLQQNIEQFKLLGKTAPVDAFPLLRFLPGDLFHVKQALKNHLKLNEMFSENFIDQFKDDIDDTSTDNFIKAYLREKQKHKDGDLNETHLSRIIDGLFSAGTDTTSATLSWAMALSIHHPECQKKIYDEIIEEVGSERMPNMQDRPRLRYLQIFILETQRWSSIAPLGGGHLCSETTHVGGYRIPKGARIVTYIDAVLKDEKVWKDPYEFRPERFLDKDGNIFVPKEYIPFSIGRRVCLGESLAKMELFLFMSAIFQRFEVLPDDPNNLPDLMGNKEALHSVIPFKLRMKARRTP